MSINILFIALVILFVVLLYLIFKGGNSFNESSANVRYKTTADHCRQLREDNINRTKI